MSGALWVWFAAAAAWPWTGLPWRAFSIPSGAALAVLALAVWKSPAWSDAAVRSWDRLETDDPRPLVAKLAALFFVWLASVKLCQYASFQSHYCDLGQDANICWNTLHGRPFFISYEGTNFLGDHFEPILALCALGLKVWESPAVLLIIQSAALALAVFPLFELARLHSRRPSLALAVVALFILNPFLHLVSEFDFHPESLFVPAALWALLFWERGKPLAALLVALPCLGIKEDVPLALAGFGAYAGLSRASTPRQKMCGWSLVAFAAAAFAVITLQVIPRFAGSQVSVHQDRYASLGQSAGDIIGNLARHPWLVALRLLRWRVLFTGFFLMLTAGFLPLAAPLALLPVLAACLHHLLSDYRSQYALVSQYSAQTIPFLFYGAVKGLAACEGLLWQERRRLAPAFLLLCALGLLFQPLYSRGFRWRNVLAVERLIRGIPPRASVGLAGGGPAHGQDVLTHLSLRTGLVDLGAAAPGSPAAADYVLLGPGARARAQAFAAGGEFARLGEADGLELWARKSPGPRD